MRRLHPPSYVSMPSAGGGGGAGAIVIADDGGVVGTFTTIKFQGNNFSVTANGNVAVVTTSGGGAGGFTNYAKFSATAGQTFFALTGVGAAASSHMVTRNGIVMCLGDLDDYVVSQAGVTFNEALEEGTRVLVWY